ncbi:hypothetical protein [Streptomyces sp. TRM68416]|uniref:hypothetical protein n=1 Tax=Streptomyces sp. TRM68416 TaxID=2758412 RepID=UPI001661B929|nr:hypothetical protein [Streptomyces sp. TRM68416]MBD0843026.1 hypothetical protein [Streptomyces sp. TRM68416]
MYEDCGARSLTAMGEPARGRAEVVRLVGHLRAAHQEGSVARMAEIAREIARTLGSAPVPGTTAAVLAEAEGAFLTDPTWPDRLMQAMTELRDHLLN